MSDSQNWASFDDDEASKSSSRNRSRQKKQAAAAAAQAQTDALTSNESASGVLENLRSLNLVTFRNRLMFGGLVGFCTGATFGGSEWSSVKPLAVLCMTPVY